MHSSIIQTCPECSRVLSFSSSNTNIIVCHSCYSTINRNTDGSLVKKPHFTILNNRGIIQPGSTGKWEKKDFTVLGRFRAWFEESVFNYWTIVFADGENAWLGEGYGIYSVLTGDPNATKLTSSDFQNDNIGKLRTLNSKDQYILEKKYRSVKFEVEGELYIPDNTVSSFRMLEYSNELGKNLVYFEFGKENILAYAVTYLDFKDLQLQGLREHDYTGKTFTCTACSLPIHVKTFPFAQSCACTSCGAQYSLNEIGDFKKEKKTRTDEVIYLPLGSSGEIDDTKYEVIGYVEKEEDNMYHSKWHEYTLYNPQQGYSFLSEYEGNWIFIRETCNSPVLLNQNEKSFEIGGEPFQLFNSYTYKVLNAKGEFPYNIYDNQKAKAKEFISPPEIWIQERDSKEGITWFLGKHISSGNIASAFKTDAMPAKKGVGAVQPVGYISKFKMFLAALFGLLFLLLLHLIATSDKEQRVLLNTVYNFTDTSNFISAVTEKYVLDKKSGNLRFRIDAPLENTWMELSVTLVNAQTGKEYAVEKGLEYYFGFSDGESWSEGSRAKDAYLTRIPAGTYFIQLDASRESSANRVNEFYLSITYDVASERNLWWSFFLIMLWIAGKYFYINTKEKARWSNSLYSPFSDDE